VTPFGLAACALTALGCTVAGGQLTVIVGSDYASGTELTHVRADAS
jgi:hypothetical protein